MEASYRNPKYNHKHKLGRNYKNEVIPVPSKHEHIVTAAKKSGLRHASSKNAKTLKLHS